MALLAQAPNTVANAFSLTMVNIRPYTHTVATAVTLVGLIYLLVLSFIQVSFLFLLLSTISVS